MTNVHRALLLAIVLPLAAPAPVFAARAEITEKVNGAGGREPTLTYTAAPGERNRITMTRGIADVQVTIRDDGADIVPGASCVADDSHTVRCTQQPYVLNGVAFRLPPRVLIDAGDGDDTVTTGGYGYEDALVFGGDGADVLTGGGHLAGGPGDDVITSTSVAGAPCDKACGTPSDVLAGGSGNDVLRGGLGNEVLIGDGDSSTSADPGGGDDVIDGGPGVDTVVYTGRAAPVRVDLGGTLLSGSPGEGDRLTAIESVTGGQGPDVLSGDDRANRLSGGPGDDTLDGRGDADQLDGGLGSDTLLGRDGDDELIGEQAGDALYGGPGDDTLSKPIGASLLLARVVHCGSGRDETFMPQGQLLSGCELVRLGDLWVNPPRRLRDGRLRTGLRCRAGLRCEVVVKIRRGPTVLARRSVTIAFGRLRILDLRPRARARAGQTVHVTISGRDIVREGPSVGSTPIGGRWRMRL